MFKLKAILGSILLLCLLGFNTILLPVAAHASLFEDPVNQACNGAALKKEGGCTGTQAQTDKVSTLLATILNILSFVVGVIAVIMIFIGGIRFVTSQGDGASTAAARNTIIYAVIGLVVAAMAQFLVQYVVNRATTTPATPAAACTPVAPATTC